jgi:lipopolysaccharide biosynthesis glycosyltransferase
VINRRNLTRWTWYRLFFTDFIDWIDRILYLDCDIIVNKDISDFYYMDMKWKTIIWNNELDIIKYYKDKYFWLNNYLNAWVLLFDVNKFKKHPINLDEIKETSKKFDKYLDDSDQDYLNIIYKNEIWIYPWAINYLCVKPFFNKKLKSALILHCLAKPHVKYSTAPKYVIDKYYFYLNQTKRKWFPKNDRSIMFYFYATFSRFMIDCCRFVFWARWWFYMQNLFKKLEHMLISVFHVKRYNIW